MTGQQTDCNCKIGRTIAEYELSDVNSRLASEWQDGKSVRRLTEEFNKEIVESVLTAVNVSRVEWSRTPVYEALHTDELNDAKVLEIQRELDHAGVDVDELSSDLVSHQTVYRHLKQCLEASKGDDQSPEERRQKAKDTVHALQQRTELVTESTLNTLQSAGITDFTEIDVIVNIQVVCNTCGRSMDFRSAIHGGCDCNAT